MVLSLLPLLILLVPPSSFASLSQNLTRPGVLYRKTLPAEAAAGLFLQNQPFTVVWNMPTANCQKQHNIKLDLEECDIVENWKQRFQGQRMTIFYRDRLGKYPYLSPDGREVNGGLPQLGDLSAHLSLTVTQMSVLLRPDFSGAAVIDWEEWQPLWESNVGSQMEYRRQSKLLVRQERPDLLEKDVVLSARQEFEGSAWRFMEETIRLAVRHRPKGFWGFYGFPSCFNKHKRKTDQTYTGRCHKGTRQLNDRLSWLWTQSTALYPSIYLPQRLAGSADAALMVRHRLLEAMRVASTWRHGNNTIHTTPVLPYARLAFTHSLNFLNQQQCILLRNYIHSTLGPFVRSLRSDTQRCSLQRCHGNGRCARRRPSSGLSLSSGRSSDPHGADESSSSRYFQRHFTCQCFPGWTGPECHEKSGQNHD